MDYLQVGQSEFYIRNLQIRTFANSQINTL